MSETPPEQPADSGGSLSFDLADRPWIGVLGCDGVQEEMSLRTVFAEAGRVRRLVGDLPTQEFALLRLLLAVAHDALDGPRDIEHWADLWAEEDCFAPVDAYLNEHRERLDLLDARTPFFQVADLRTGKGEVASLNRIVADVPNGDPFFTSRMPGVSHLSFAEAARWVVHAHAFDTSGIKSGAEGDTRVKGGKVYPLGVGWAGTLGGVFAEGDTLRETLLLNLVAADTNGLRFEAGDRPAWRRAPDGPGVSEYRQPTGLRDLYTWQTRRLRLHFDKDGVHGVVLGYGDPLGAHNMHTREPMTAWRRSLAQEKKRGEPLVYLPREHDPARAAWRGLASLIAERTESGQGAQAATYLRPGILEWVSRLATEGELERTFLIRARVIGPVYGTQQSVIDEIMDDSLSMGVVLLHNRDRAYAMQAIDAVGDAEKAVMALGDLATDLARAAGAESDGPRSTARDRGFGSLDGPYRAWLAGLAGAPDPYLAREAWKRDVHRTVGQLGRQLLAGAGDAAWAGRTVPGKQGTQWLNSGLADTWFRARLANALGTPQDDSPLPDPADASALLPKVTA
ncbi:type I-E CRISPR-associated protein Cse1/CasA (plasmid) [Streptomyces clavifer]|uniref:type I-E CRISPR-associated protein Cse1/CasA n=1 Tax=Streptomyces clavifer TaxID=68188 RepID=UPI002E806AE2|nr:type I-E CRISPR-associated protein Cse1/CasA [Streptomyces clavifer]WUC32479.1 type I-E CRISPR-associated protein Cse1/CasA [Streptomyces clavifer]